MDKNRKDCEDVFMRKVAKKLGVYALVGMMTVGGFGATQVKASTGATTVTAQAVKQTQKKDFYDVLQTATSVDEVLNYIKKYSKTATKAEMNEYMSGLFSFCDDIREVNFAKLKSVKKYLPTDVQNALPLLIKEYNTPAMKEGVAKISVEKLLARTVAYEKYLKKNTSGVAAKAIKNLYEEELNFAITGGFHKEMALPNTYADETGTKVDQNIISSYKAFVKANSTTKTGKIVSQYVKLLNKTNGKITSKVQKFYDNLYQTMRKQNL